MAADQTNVVRTGGLEVTSMRYHELALMAWLNRKFVVHAGYPVPVVFASPMDAFSKFQDLWRRDHNPFRYLYDLKDENGTPLYEPYPSPPKLPLLSVMRRGWKYRQYQNFSIHNWRHLNWPTVSEGVKREDLGTVTVSRMPMAFDYRFQVEYYSMRPDTQAFYIERMMNQFFRSGGSLQTWLPINYPGIGQFYIRLIMDGDSLEWSTPDEPETDKITEYRTTVNLTLEGYSIDADFQQIPTLWTLLVNNSADTPSPDELRPVTPIATENLRINNANPTLTDDSRTPVPANGPGASIAATYADPGDEQFIFLGTGAGDTSDPVFVPPAAYSYGVPSAEVVGVPTVVQT